MVGSSREWCYLYNFHLSCSISYSHGEAEGSHSSFRLSLDHSVAEVPSSCHHDSCHHVFLREDIDHHAFLQPESFLGLFKNASLDSFNSLEKKLVLMASFRTFCPEDKLTMSVTISVDGAVCMWSKYCGFLTPYMSAGGTKLSLKMLFLRDYYLFSSSFVVMTVEGKNTGNLIFEMMMVLEEELPTWSHQALPKKAKLC